ncbi:MAG: DUF5060 domain-containing protein [Candidatus Sulfopaludibacter sp.]|nr:DUF5060 domain-containing protein [Candidatus Sulfopaludibacter sp.]
MVKRWGGATVALALCLLKAQAPAPAPPCANTPAYSPCEMVFQLSDRESARHPNPYATVDLRAELRSPHQKTYAVPAYWDGERRMVIRFTPTEAGDWDWRLTSNIEEWNDKQGSFTAAPSDAPGFLRVANVHHFAYLESKRAHLWMGASEPLLMTLDDAQFQAVADARAAQKFNHLRFLVMAQGLGSAYSPDGLPNLPYFQKLDRRIEYLNGKGITADLILTGGAGYLLQQFPTAGDRRLFIRFLAGRYAGLNITWQGVDYFEDYPDGRDILKEIGAAIKQMDGYQHPRTSGARLTSAPLLDDGWEDFAAYGTSDDNVAAIEHQLYPVPQVNLECGREDSGAGKTQPHDVDPAAFRHNLWNATMDGQYATYSNTGSGPEYVNSPGAKAMTAWYDMMATTRHWDLEPYYDVDGGRALALEDVEYLVYIEKPGPVELTVEDHNYDVIWMDPNDGSTMVAKKYHGKHFTGEPPDRYHDWVLHVVRESTLESMNRSYYFEAADIQMQEVEVNPPKIPFDVDAPRTDTLRIGQATPFAITIKKATRATRQMMWLWTGEVTADHRGYRVLATGQKGAFTPQLGLAFHYPANLLLKLYGMNSYGKVYLVSKGFELTQ